jgi:transposase
VEVVPRAAVAIALSPEQEGELRRRLRTPSLAQKDALRARIVLRAAEGASNTEIAGELGVSLPTVSLWRAQFAREGLAGLADRARSGRPRTIDEEAVQRVLAKTLEPPPAGESHWSVRRLASETGLSSSTVHRIWRTHRLKPHRTRTFKYSRDPQLVAKVIDIVGLYLDPPDGALVLCVDEKTQVQALDRTQPMLPLRPGLPERRTHDYKRNGTTNLYAALEIASGQVVTACQPRHRHQEFLAFLRRIVREFPTGELHLVLDNSSTHTTPEVARWLARHKRVHFHFTPTSASWMNLVESWFSILTRQQVRRGSYASVAELIAAIDRFVAGYNERALPFVWTKTAEHVLTKAIKQQPTSETEH